MKICAESDFETSLFLAIAQEKSMWIFSRRDGRLTVEPPGEGDKCAAQKPLSRFPFTLQTCNEGLDAMLGLGTHHSVGQRQHLRQASLQSTTS